VWTLATGPDLSLGDDPRTFDLWDSSPTVADDTVYVGSGDGKVYAADLDTGRERWSHATGSRVRSSPAVGGGTLYIGSFDGCVYALDAATGLGLSMEFTEGAIYSSVVPTDGLVLVGSDDHHLYAFKTKPAAPVPDSASPEILRAMEGRYRTESGDDYTLSLQHGRLSVAFCTYPPALVTAQADGSFSCPMLWERRGNSSASPASRCRRSSCRNSAVIPSQSACREFRGRAYPRCGEP